jgi:hypothetical protein
MIVVIMNNYTPQNVYDITESAVKEALANLDTVLKNVKGKQAFMGFDGYIDTIYRMVKNRPNANEVIYYDNMAEFGKRIMDAAGSSASIERILKKKLGGGFTANMARAMANMGPDMTVHLYGALGLPDEDPIFASSLPQNVKRKSVGQMGLTLAMEFHDGKIMSQDMEGIITLTWDKLISQIGGRDRLIDIFNQVDVIGTGHWALMTHMTNYWEHFLADIFPNVSNLKKKYFFVDPADIQKRTKADIQNMIFTLKQINENMPVVLSLNDRETIDVANALSEYKVPPVQKGKPETYREAGKNINQVANLQHLLVHDPHFATMTSPDLHIWVTEGYTSKPGFTTAAGDHFNAGILIGLMGGLSSAASLVIANAATAIFVRTGKSPNKTSLKKFISTYFDYILNDISTFECIE